jgi:methylphosphotriester-DNA--protein-cysteine methyltransferase
MTKTWTLVGPDGEFYASDRPGMLGGHRRTRIYGRLDCPAARRAIRRGGYIRHRVFFLDEDHAQAAGYRPCGVCLAAAYAKWKAKTAKDSTPNSKIRSTEIARR